MHQQIILVHIGSLPIPVSKILNKYRRKGKKREEKGRDLADQGMV